MLILSDLRVLGCLTTTAPRSVSNSWHFLGFSRLCRQDLAMDGREGLLLAETRLSETALAPMSHSTWSSRGSCPGRLDAAGELVSGCRPGFKFPQFSPFPGGIGVRVHPVARGTHRVVNTLVLCALLALIGPEQESGCIRMRGQKTRAGECQRVAVSGCRANSATMAGREEHRYWGPPPDPASRHSGSAGFPAGRLRHAR
jgi:hypothetical protein